jgi:hypothetical protein
MILGKEYIFNLIVRILNDEQKILTPPRHIISLPRLDLMKGRTLTILNIINRKRPRYQ